MGRRAYPTPGIITRTLDDGSETPAASPAALTPQGGNDQLLLEIARLRNPNVRAPDRSRPVCRMCLTEGARCG